MVFSSIVDETMSAQLGLANALFLDVFQVFIAPLEAELDAKSSHAAGRSHGIANPMEYFARMEAINFAQAHDDGAATRDLGKAQLILIGVSRCGKTPTTLYLALQFGILAGNFPLTPDDFTDGKLPGSILPYRDRLFGLTIDPERLQQIRQARRPNSKYAALENCRYEVREAEQLMQRERIPDPRHDRSLDRGDRDHDSASGRPAAARFLVTCRSPVAAARSSAAATA